MTPLVVAAAAAVVMEPVAAVVHRLVMHRRAWYWHRSHHRPAAGGLERNDAFPMVFALVTIVAMAIGSRVDRLAPLLWAGAGISAYGLAYLIVHDLYIHQRLGPIPGRHARYVRWVARGHGHHHRDGLAPFGFLLPLVPRHRRVVVDTARALDRSARTAVGSVAERDTLAGTGPR